MNRNSIYLLGMVLLLSGGQAMGGEEDDGNTILFSKPVKAVIFQHELHLRQRLDCSSCHPVLFDKKAGSAEKNEDFTMNSISRGKYCGACHDGKTAFAANTDCTRCHIGVRGYRRFLKKGE